MPRSPTCFTLNPNLDQDRLPLRAHPLLFEVNTRLLLGRLTPGLGRAATLTDVTDKVLDGLLPAGIDWVWLLGVWQTGQAAPAISRAHPDLRHAAEVTLGSWTDEDIAGSCFAIVGYDVDERFGGADALATLRARLAARGIRLMLDFVPNHTAPDHPWVRERPDLYVCADDATIETDPANWRRMNTKAGERVIALGRDPYFPGWIDTLQLDYAHPETQSRMQACLTAVASLCDGVRVDMAMLVLPEVFRRTWHREAAEFWPDAIIAARRVAPGFTLMAEVYWGLDEALIARGFDYAYDKSLYDALAARDAAGARACLAAPVDRQARAARFIENHDEQRAASVFPWPVERAAGAIALLAPGLRLLHQGQMHGARAHVSMHLGRGPDEPSEPDIVVLHQRLLAVLSHRALHEGEFAPLDPEPAWGGNPSNAGFVVFRWTCAGAETILVAVNFAPNRGQCRVFLEPPWPGVLRLIDLLGDEQYIRAPDEIATEGLYLDLPGWGANVFELGGG